MADMKVLSNHSISLCMLSPALMVLGFYTKDIDMIRVGALFAMVMVIMSICDIYKFIAGSDTDE